MTRLNLSRMRACDHCGEGLPDGDIHEIYHEGGRTEGFVHEHCIRPFIAVLDEVLGKG